MITKEGLKIKKIILILIFICLTIFLSGTASAAADLNVKSIDAPSIGSEEKTNITVTIENDGNETAYFDNNFGSGTPITLFLSSDNELDDSDGEIGTVWHDHTNPPIAPGESFSQIIEITGPATPEGNYFLIAGLDKYQVWIDGMHYSDGIHGINSIPIYIKNPNLTVTSFNAPDSVSTQETINVNFTVTNQGSSVAGPGEQGKRCWVDQLYLSSDNQLDASDTFLGEWYFTSTPLQVGDSYNNAITFNVPTLPTGTYFLIANLNSRFGDNWGGYIYESDLSPGIKPIFIKNPDLIVTNITAPNSVHTQESVNVTYTVKNQGNGDINNTSIGNLWFDNIYLSNDTQWSEDDLKLVDGWYPITNEGPLTAGSSYNRTQTIEIPLIPEGDYYLLIGTDGQTQYHGCLVYESNETNNLLAKPITVLPPSVLTIDPIKNALNVADSKIITITFSGLIKAGNNFITLKNSIGVTVPITTSIVNQDLTIAPNNPLAEDIYTLCLHSGSVTDLAGNPLAIWSSKFTVGASPVVNTVNPVNNAISVARDQVISVTFNEVIKKGTNFIELKDSMGTIIPITTSVCDNVLTINHLALLNSGVKYTAIIHTSSLTDLAGNPVALWSSKFTTCTDATPPTVISTDPVNNALNVARDKVISVTFSEPIKAGNLWIEFYNDSTQIPINIAINGNILTITHTALLAANTKYTLSLHTGSILDLAGNPLALAGRIFTTSADTVAPVMVSSDPVINTINVPRNKTIKITFNEPIKAGTLWIELYNGTTQTPITKTISGNILTITHTALLAANTKYTLCLHTGSILDLVGNPLTLFTRVFTTGST